MYIFLQTLEQCPSYSSVIVQKNTEWDQEYNDKMDDRESRQPKAPRESRAIITRIDTGQFLSLFLKQNVYLLVNDI